MIRENLTTSSTGSKSVGIALFLASEWRQRNVYHRLKFSRSHFFNSIHCSISLSLSLSHIASRCTRTHFAVSYSSPRVAVLPDLPGVCTYIHIREYLAFARSILLRARRIGSRFPTHDWSNVIEWLGIKKLSQSARERIREAQRRVSGTRGVAREERRPRQMESAAKEKEGWPARCEGEREGGGRVGERQREREGRQKETDGRETARRRCERKLWLPHFHAETHLTCFTSGSSVCSMLRVLISRVAGSTGSGVAMIRTQLRAP